VYDLKFDHMASLSHEMCMTCSSLIWRLEDMKTCVIV